MNKRFSRIPYDPGLVWMRLHWHTLACTTSGISRDEHERERPKRRDRAPEFARTFHTPHPLNFVFTAF
jgi:hypothetical protein